MVVQNFDVIDIVAEKKGIPLLAMVEGRKWKDSKNIYSLMFSQLILKALNYAKYANSEDFKKKYKNSGVVIAYHTIDEPPKEVRDFLKENKVEIIVGD